jgi:hypothetical protein
VCNDGRRRVDDGRSSTYCRRVADGRVLKFVADRERERREGVIQRRTRRATNLLNPLIVLDIMHI